MADDEKPQLEILEKRFLKNFNSLSEEANNLWKNQLFFF